MALVPAAQPSTSSPSYYYDVFLSFKGKDTRKTFTDHLQTALLQSGLSTFRNIYEYGELERHEAIRRSRVSVIVLSGNYALSKRCLDELVLIIECRRRIGQFVLPVFYHLDPSEILKQKEEFREKFDGWRHEWRSALGEVANMASEYAMILNNFAEGYEAKFIQKTVNVIEDKLSRPMVRVARYPIGIEFRARNISLWLQQKSTNVELLVICGMGGIGKTTIAKFVYNLNFKRFECSSFLANVRETCEQPNGLVQLQNQLLSNILKGERPKVWNVDEGIIKIKESLCHKRSLLVLDDVDEMYQLDALIGKREFHPGSKIIITTRNKWFLKADNVHKVHTVEKLDDNESLELFSCYAFGKKHPVEGYMDLSERVVRHCMGIPLALLVLGSSLSGRSPALWTSALEKLEAIPDAQIIQKLKVSYDCLQDDHDRNLFLHIACFFIGEDKDCVGKILDKCDFFSIVGIQNLADRCLLKIELGTKLTMHHLIQDMAREIVRKESPTRPGERSRLWHHVDSFGVLKEKSGTERVQGLTLDMRMFNMEKSAQSTFYGHDSRKRQRETISDESFLSSSHQTSSKRQHLTIFSWEWVHNHLKWPNEMDLETDAFTKLDNLKLLRINYVQLNGCYDYFPENLRWLCWHGFPSTYLPGDLRLRNLVSLDLSYSKLEQVWKQTKLLGCLRILNLSYSRGLTETPDFSGLPSLEKLLLKGCVTLVGICESIAKSEDLTLLDLEDCKNLINLPGTLWKLRYLETLIISGCSSLGEFPMDLRNMESLKELRADGSSIINPSLTVARNKKWWHPFVWSKPCRNPDVVWASLPSSLVKLHLANSNLSQDSFPKDFSNLSLLKHLNLSKNPIRVLPDAVRSLGKLEILDFTSCPHLQLLVDLPSSLEALWLDNCESLERVTSLNGLALSNLVKENCRKLAEVEGYFRLEPISKVNQEIINDLGLINVGSMGNLELYLDDGFSYYNGKRPIQGLFQFGIFSTFIPSGEVPSWFEENKVRESSVSFTVPLDARFKCLNVCCVYGETDTDEVWSPHPAFIKVHNKTKNLTWIYCPVFFGLPDHEELAWLSQWNFGNHLECGNEATISFIVGDAFQVKECGVKLISFNQVDNQVEKEDDEIVGGDLLAFEEPDEVMGRGDLHAFEEPDEVVGEDLQAFEEPDEVVGGDLQAFEFTEGKYFLFRDRFRHIIGMDDWTSTQWFRNLFGDSLDVLDALAGSWDGN